MKKFSLLMLLGVLAGCGAANEKAIIQKYLDVTPNKFEGAVAVVLNDEETSKIDDKGESRVVEGFKRIKILKRSATDCSDDSSTCRVISPVGYDETWDTVEMIEARTITPDGQVLKVEPKDIKDTTFTSWAIPDQSGRVKMFSFKGVQPGSILELRYRVRSRKIIDAGGFRFQERDPVLEARYTMDTPADYEYKWKTYNIDVKPTVQKKGNRIIRTWEAKQIPAFQPEEGMVAPDDLVAQLKIANEKVSAFGEFDKCKKIKTWEDMGNCWAQMIKSKQEATPAVKDLARKIASENKTETDKLKAVWKYMNENIRYVGLERGLEGFIPLSAGVVCSKKYGDCKAVAGLISVLCRQMGMEADPILIGTRPQLGMVPLDLPGPFHFNHSIARVVADGKVYWMDATVRDASFDTTPFSDQGVDVLVAHPSKPFLDRIPVQGPETNNITGTVKFTPGKDGSLTLDLVGKATGNYAMIYRSIAHRYTGEQFEQKLLAKILTTAYPAANLKNFKYTGKEHNDEPFTIDVQAVVSKAVQPMDKGLTMEIKSPLTPRVFKLFDIPKRHYPVDLEFLSSINLRFEVKIPDGMEPTGMPKNVMFEDDYVKIERLAQIENDSVVAVYNFSFKQLIIPPDKYKAARASFLKAMDASKFVLIFEPPKKKKA